MKWGSANLLPALILSACMSPSPPPAATPWTDNFNTARDPEIVAEARPFIIRRQGCDHFRGEPPYSPERRTFLDKRIGELCTGADAELQRLRQRYRDHPKTIEALADFEDCIEYDSACSATPREK